MTAYKWIIVILGIIAVVFLGLGMNNIWENVPADEICMMQNIVDGKLTPHVDQGLKLQKFAKITYYPKRFVVKFTVDEDSQGNPIGGSNKIRFNDGGEGWIMGSVNVELPLTPDLLKNIHVKYGSFEAFRKELIEPVFAKAIFNCGPLMSSEESYSKRRNELINYIGDQAVNGVYKTMSEEVKGIDQMTGQAKTVTVVRLMLGEDGKPLREDTSPFDLFGIKTYNLAIERIPYSKIVQDQIASQQKAKMAVQTAVANAKEAEQDAITVAKTGEADAAKAKWEQEVVKAKAVVQAEQLKEVAALERDAARFEKEKQILLGEGEAKRKQLVMTADGALKQKLATYEKVMGKFAEEFGKQKWTPEISINSGPSNGDSTGSKVNELINMLTIKTAQDLQLDTAMKSNK